jgi:hypothetical protein
VAFWCVETGDLVKKEQTDLERLVGIGRDLERGRGLSMDARAWMKTVDRSAVVEAVSRAVPSEGENVRRAVTRIAMQRGWELHSIALPPADERVKSPSEGNRVAESNGSLALSADALASGIPDDDVVLAYVRRGDLARYVEGVAASNVGFAEELRGVIDALAEAGEMVGDAARKWRATTHSNVLKGEAVAVAPVVSLESARKRRTMVFVQFGLAAALILGVGFYYVNGQREKQAAVQAAKEKELADKNAELARLMRELEAQKAVINEAQAEARNAASEAERASAQAKLAAAIEEQRKTMQTVSAVRAASSGAASPKHNAKAACTCQAGDPLCSCL